MQDKKNGYAIDIVIDITLGDQGKAIDFLENLLKLEEGVPFRYLVQLGHRRLFPELQERVLKFAAEKNARLSYALPAYDFPQELIDKETGGTGKGQHRIPLSTKRNWFDANLVLLKAISAFDEFVFLSPDAVIMQNSWLRKLKSCTEKSSLPVQGCFRKMDFRNESVRCGWSAIGWYDGRALRKLPIKKLFSDRIPNPWNGKKEAGAPWQPGYCLAQDRLSAFDAPLGYALFALYFEKMTRKNDPMAWHFESGKHPCDFLKMNRPDDPAEKWGGNADRQVLMVSEIGPPDISRKVLRQHSFQSTRNGSKKDRQQELKRLSVLPLSGPKYNLIGDNRRKLTIDDLGNMFRGERCFIIGNGPSLNKTDLKKLKNEYTIGLNRIYLNYEKMGFQTTFLCVTNPNVLKQFGEDIDQLASVKFLRYHHDYIKNRWNAFFMEHTGFHHFIKDLRDCKWCEGCTVTYCALQVAFFLGFETVILVGVDHNFPDSGKPHQLVSAKTVDTNHFHPDYFAKGVKWQYPDLAGSEVSYRVADNEFRRDGRIVIDATVGGHLDIFPKCEFDRLFEESGNMEKMR